MNEEDLKHRTKQFSLRIIRLVEALPSTSVARTIGNQLLRSGTSIAANYRAACCGRSKPDFIAKAGLAPEEADESLYWMELLAEAKIMPADKLQEFMNKANELIAIFTASVKTSRARPAS